MIKSCELHYITEDDKISNKLVLCIIILLLPVNDDVDVHTDEDGDAKSLSSSKSLNKFERGDVTSCS